MTQAERRHDRLAVRLSLIISRLVAGETLNMARLAAEFGVSVRTLRRDFRERLMYLDLEYRRGQCRLRSTGGGVQGELDALTFAHRAGLADIFPGLDRRLAGALLASDGTPCLVWQSPQPIAATSPLVFYRLVSAITGSQRVLLLADGERCDGLAPYRLIFLDGCWYLTGELNGHITVHPLATIHAVTILNTTFTPRKRLSLLTTQAGFIRALPHFSCIREVLSQAADNGGSG
ncbi:TPA: DeoR family transcriptional regulator [Citrobacter koseri]|mgnify:FL=1|uniref:DeoR family transcriptional regulator n=1 Tax=Citrobacter sp. Cpo090 TaxID=2985139 RepID=UPI002576E3F1|nr:DeoR family transcriptional regulator [Citrobacter sp. Cpo090]MDM2846208.1 DeoR family transcriptional regulator [Citrobacter sp. Cpo090]